LPPAVTSGSWRKRPAESSNASSLSGGAAKTELWLKIKASIYGVPIIAPKEPECGVIRCAAMAATATGRLGSIEEAVGRYVRLGDDVAPDPDWTETHARIAHLQQALGPWRLDRQCRLHVSEHEYGMSI
jgi:sugar (pentulose or hexulose) kinase